LFSNAIKRGTGDPCGAVVELRESLMHEPFRKYVEYLRPAFERLMAMHPVSIETLPRSLPRECIYLFSEGGSHLYVGRTRRLRNRLRQHSIPAAQHNQAGFAFRLARERTGRLEASYNKKDSRKALQGDPAFAAAFDEAKGRIRKMDLRFVEEHDPLKQALLEIYVSVVLGTPYNDFNTR
jgi:predicted GIY-YIG superfamily endonuclease